VPRTGRTWKSAAEEQMSCKGFGLGLKMVKEVKCWSALVACAEVGRRGADELQGFAGFEALV
jgi:hypothetical protein